MFDQFRDKTVVVTGHTGFKGSWLAAWLQQLGARVVGVALDPPTEPSHFIAIGLGSELVDHRVDIRDRDRLAGIIVGARPDFVFHLAAQPLVRRAYANPVETYHTNVLGTLYVLEALRQLTTPTVAVLITSDKCYDNVEWVWGYRETDTLGGSDPYSGSKGAAELVIRSHVRSFFQASAVRIGVGRAGNVIGGGDWAEDRVVPDCVRAWSSGQSVSLRNPQATRPWQHVLEPLSGYLTLALELSLRRDLHGEAFNFGPAAHQDHTVLELVQEMSRHWPQVRWNAAPDAAGVVHEPRLLKLNCDKAQRELHWQAVLNFEHTVRLTAEWYREFYARPSAIGDVTRRHIQAYTRVAEEQGMGWTRRD